jgi:ABC-2 type transport system ATP-binding protein/ribosome-dependent ATPase
VISLAAKDDVLARTSRATRRFGSFTAVQDVSIEVGPGEIVGLLGANGAGKTTLMRLMLGLLPVSSGSVSVFGGPPSRRTRARLGYVPQGLGLYMDLTVAENLRFYAAAFGVESSPADLPDGLAEAHDSLVGQIGLGRQRQLAFACALSHHPSLVVLDEPTSGVDPLARSALWDQVHDQTDRGVGVILTTHYLEEAHQCDRLVIMAAGKVVARGTLTEITRGQRTARVRCESWASAFNALTAAGMPVTLSGRQVRVPGAPREQVLRVLRTSGVDAEVDEMSATLEETMTMIRA